MPSKRPRKIPSGRKPAEKVAVAAPKSKVPKKRAVSAKAKGAEVVAAVEVPAERGLTPKQAAFVREYLVDRNATQAAIRAKYAEGSAKITGHRLLTNANVAAEIAKGTEKQAKRLEISADRVLNELARIGFSDISEIMSWAGADPNDDWPAIHEDTGIKRRPPPFIARLEITPSADLTKDQTAVISEISESIDQHGKVTTKVKLHDKLGALKLLGEHLKLFVKKHEHSGPDGAPIQHEVSELSEDELDRRIAEAEARIKAATGGKPRSKG